MAISSRNAYHLRRNTHRFKTGVVMCFITASPLLAAPPTPLQALAYNDAVKDAGGNTEVRLYMDRYVLLTSSNHEHYLALSAAIGGDGEHSIRFTWFYAIRSNSVHRLFRLPFDATAIHLCQESPARPDVFGSFWIFNCFTCDGPELSEELLKIPVVAHWSSSSGTYVLTFAAPEEQKTRIRIEAFQVLHSAKSKGMDKSGIRNLEEAVNQLLMEGLTPDACTTLRLPPPKGKLRNMSRVGNLPSSSPNCDGSCRAVN